MKAIVVARPASRSFARGGSITKRKLRIETNAKLCCGTTDEASRDSSVQHPKIRWRRRPFCSSLERDYIPTYAFMRYALSGSPLCRVAPDLIELISSQPTTVHFSHTPLFIRSKLPALPLRNPLSNPASTLKPSTSLSLQAPPVTGMALSGHPPKTNGIWPFDLMLKAPRRVAGQPLSATIMAAHDVAAVRSRQRSAELLVAPRHRSCL